MTKTLSSAFPYKKQRRRVLDREMAYVGDPIVLLQGNPTSSYLWRNVIPHLQSWPTLLPDRGPDRYRFVEHRRYLDALDVRVTPVRPRLTVSPPYLGARSRPQPARGGRSGGPRHAG